MELSRRHQRHINLATRMAEQSTYGTLKHGAVLVKGGSVVNASCNKNNFCSFGKRFRSRSEGRATLHAELGTILGLDRRVTRGTTVYVVRINRKGEHRMSKPCQMCESALRHCGVSKVYYTDEEGGISCLKL